MATVKGDFVHLHLHSQYSLLDGAIRFPQLFERLSENGVNAVALTDHGNMFGAFDFFRQAKEHGIHPIIGCEVYVAPESRFKKKRDTNRDTSNHLILLAKDNEGYRNLIHLVSLGYIEGFYYKPRIDHELLEKYHAGLIALSACLKGEIPSLLLSKDTDGALERIRYYRDLFGKENFYLEIQSNGISEQATVNDVLKQISRDEGIPLVATNDCHYLRRKDSEAHEVLLCLQTGKTIHDKGRMKFQTNEFYVKSPEEMMKQFQDVPEAIENTLEIAKRCDVDLSFKGYLFPSIELPEGRDHDTYLEEKAVKGLEAYFAELRAQGKKFDEKLYRERLAYELDTIKKMGFSDYFLIVSDFVGYAKSHQIAVGPGRGSAAGSLVSFALGITEIDPIPYKLMFERFLTPGRVSMPDIDCDFSEEKRDQVLRYVMEKYGSDHVAQIITFASMNARGVIRDVGRVLGMPYAEVDRVAKAIPATPKITLDEAVKLSIELREMIENDPAVARLMEIARTLEGLYRHSSTHAAGVVIGSKPLIDLLPIYVGQKGEVLTQFDMGCVESIGLVKFDFLGLSTLSVIERAVNLVRETREADFDLKSIPLDDKKTYELLRKGDVSGVFQLESSSGMRDLVVRVKPRIFEDLIALLALYRPGPLESGMADEFVRRKNNKKLVTYDIPELKEILDDSYGVILYQEQVMRIAMKLAGFTPTEADKLRKAMGKKRAEEMAKLREKFVEGAVARGTPKKKAEALYEQIAKFASYGFNKSHSTAYAMIAYQTAYLKTHYPIEFMASLLNTEIGNSDKLARYIEDCKGKGIEVFPPDANKSDLFFTVEDGGIRFGLAGIKNVGEGAAEIIVRERKENGSFTSFLDFCTRLDLRKVNKRVLDSLIKCGAFDSLGVSRARLFEGLDEVLSIAQEAQKRKKSQQKSLFSVAGEGGTNALELRFDYPGVEDWPQGKRLLYEKELLGVYLTGNPLKRHEEKLKALNVTPIDELGKVNGRKSVKIAGMVVQTKEITTKKKEKMAFVKLEDLTGAIEVVVFPSVFTEVAFYLLPDEPIMVEGTLDKSGEVFKVKAVSVTPLKDAEVKRPFHVFLPVDNMNTEGLFGLRAFLEEGHETGGCPVVLHVLDDAEGEEAVIALPENYAFVRSRFDAFEGRVKKLFGERARIEI